MRLPLSPVVLAVLAVAALAGGLLLVVAPQPPEVDVHRASRGPLEVTVEDEGETRVKELFVVSAPISGQMRRIELEPGDPVLAGKTVVTYIEALRPRFFDLRETTEYRARVESAKASRDLAAANVERSRAELTLAEQDLERNRELVKKGAASSRTLESAEVDVRVKQAELVVARNTLAAKEAEVRVAEAALLQAPAESSGEGVPADASKAPPASAVVSPISGVLLRRIKESESVVAAGEPLFEVGSPQSMEILVELISEDAVKVKPGARATIDGWGGGRALEGAVRRVEPYGFTKVSALGIEEQRVNVVLDLSDPADAFASLGHGYRVDVAIRVWYGERVLTVPIGALFRDGNEWALYRMMPDRTAALTHVAIGHTNDRDAEVLGGLDEGDTVILHPSDRIASGRPVRVRQEGDTP